MPSKGATHCPLSKNGKFKSCPVKTLLLQNDPWLKQIPGSQAWTTDSDLAKDFPLSSNLLSLGGGQPLIVKVVKGTELRREEDEKKWNVLLKEEGQLNLKKAFLHLLKPSPLLSR